ncbi:MAG TPA: hypothetical protein VMI94_07880 [Bryobacteraceae bacterium]|nr:hypothetical protein [Bryobacteraceae bacterium]
MRANPRNRIVVFRLTQDEFQNLKLACDRSGARNVSEFTRTEILSALDPDQREMIPAGLDQIRQEIAKLQAALTKVLLKLEERNYEGFVPQF